MESFRCWRKFVNCVPKPKKKAMMHPFESIQLKKGLYKQIPSFPKATRAIWRTTGWRSACKHWLPSYRLSAQFQQGLGKYLPVFDIPLTITTTKNVLFTVLILLFLILFIRLCLALWFCWEFLFDNSQKKLAYSKKKRHHIKMKHTKKPKDGTWINKRCPKPFPESSHKHGTAWQLRLPGS